MKKWWIKSISNETPHHVSSFRVHFSPRQTTRNIFSNKRTYSLTEDQLQEGCRLGADSHADISVAGKHARVLSTVDGHVCTVHPFHDGYSPKKNVKLVNVAYAYDAHDGHTYILILNQCLDFTDDMEHSLFCTNQFRSHGIIVDDVPACYDYENKSRQTIYIPEKDITLPLLSHGPTLYLPVRYPSQDELNECEHLELTSHDLWEPHNLIPSISQLKSTLEKSPDDPLDFSTMIASHIHIDAITTTVKGDLSPSYLSRLWNVSLDSAKRTLQATKQTSLHIIKNGLTRRRKANRSRLDYIRLNGYLADFASDTFFSNVVSLRGNTCVQLFANKGNYVKPYPMKSKSEAGEALSRFLVEVGLPNSLLTDGALELKKSRWGKLCRKHGITQRTTEPHCPWQNWAEPNGGAAKRAVRHLLRTTNSPVRLWDYCREYFCGLKRLTVTTNIHLDGVTPHEKVHEKVPNITDYFQYRWFEWVWVANVDHPDDEQLGRWLGPSFSAGDRHTSHILTSKGTVIYRSSLRPMKEGELDDQVTQRQCNDFTKEMESYIRNYATATYKNHNKYGNDPYEHIFEADDLDDESIIAQEEKKDGDFRWRPDADVFLENDPPFVETSDEHIGMELTLPHQGELRRGKIIKRKRNEKGELVGTAHDNTRLTSVMVDIRNIPRTLLWKICMLRWTTMEINTVF